MATTPDCLFCKIASAVIPVTRLYENEAVLAFPDIHPQAPVHILIIPKRHFASIARTSATEAELLSELLLAANKVAQLQHLDNGFRLVFNTGPDGGQTVDHLHVHLLGGRQMHWPPG
jgi:histidine triad (HIT) family protein